ncbi:hypothetical protein SELMODRAFT_429014 [Selaginella moellendorffii]|uniref:Uncharacterized protein n=1 Tax=Selaginella moellendorffii TaxID=88036 RepID=D8T4S0_SELML|nr:hypothetical protein SELMODRAFT_429014 [Selaginella moellendorffii]
MDSDNPCKKQSFYSYSFLFFKATDEGREIVAAEEWSQAASSFSLDDDKYLGMMFTTRRVISQAKRTKLTILKATIASLVFEKCLFSFCLDRHGLQTLTVYGNSSIYDFHVKLRLQPTRGASISSLMATRVYPQAIHAVVINTSIFPKIKIASSDNPLDVTMLYMHLEYEEQYHHIVVNLYVGYMPKFLFFNIMKSMSVLVDSNEIQRLNEVYKTHCGLTLNYKISKYFIPNNQQSLAQAESLCSETSCKT